MHNKSKNFQAGSGTTRSAALVKELVELFSRGEWVQLEKKARAATLRNPGDAFAWKALGKALLKQDKFTQASTAFSRVVKLSPGDADTHNELGLVLQNQGLPGEAEASFRRALHFNPGCAEAYSNLSVLLSDHSRFDEAVELLERALAINPNSAAAHNNMGHLQRCFGRLGDAETSFRRALELNPGYFEGWINHGLILNDLEQLDRSQASYRTALQLKPASDLALQLLGSQLDRLGREQEAVSCLERAIVINPDNADAHNALGNIMLRAGEKERSLALFRRARQLRPFSSTPAHKEQAEFSVLLLDSPGPGSTPLSYLTSRAPYDCHIYCVLPEAPQDLEPMLKKADVVINMIADADSGRLILPYVQDIVERLGLPTLNQPRTVSNTDRETVARLLADIPGCRIPKTVRLAGRQLVEGEAQGVLHGFALPLLVRIAGNHGGDDFEKLEDLPAIVRFVSKRPEANYYLSEFVDYRSQDGYFRKYRLIGIAGELLPYHLAIHDDWKVHHFRTDMANQLWMRQEEEQFLQNPQLVFGEDRLRALRAVAAATGLDYCGIDCALDRDGRVVVFETNASMLVHDEKDRTFAYKNPYVARIKAAFDARLARLASGRRQNGLGPRDGGVRDSPLSEKR